MSDFLQGTYEVRGWAPSFQNVPTMLVKNGDYKIEMTYNLKDEVKYGARFFASVINIYF